VLAGTEEGFSQADDLARQGVDIKTRSKVAAVTAATNAVGFALPAAGKTWMQTGALALVGGPASFMAQNAATREILQAADYSRLADQYDPLDPVGLAFSTLVPFGVGTMAKLGAKAKGKVPDAPPPVHPPDEVVDAARVSLVRQQMDAANPLPDDLAAADAHVKAYTTAMDQMAAGERVNVDVPEALAAKATEEMAARLEDLRQAQAGEFQAKGTPDAPMQDGAAQSQTSETVSGGSRNVDQTGQIFNPNALASEASQLLSDGRTPGEVIGQMQAAGKDVSPELQNMLIGASEFGGRINDLVDQVNALKAQRGTGAKPFDLIAQAVENMRSGTKVDAPKPSNPTESLLADLEVRNPTALDAEIPFEFDANGKPTTSMSAREYLDLVKKEAAMDAADANLIEVAATCFLSGGI